MRSPGEIWRQRIWVWAPALVFFLANTTAYTIYRFGFADRQAALEQDLKEEKARLDPLVARELKLTSLLARSKRNQDEIRKLYAESFATRRERLTNFTAEVKTLARKAGLDPRSFSYPEQKIQRYGLVKRSFIFSVEGNYKELRSFINLLELSDSFITLEEVTLSEGTAGQPVRGQGRGMAVQVPDDPNAELRINLTLSTLFAHDPNDSDEPPPARRAAT
jgi:hypothetical protein